MSNFEFLRNDFPALADFGGLAERYYKSDPNSYLMKLGMMGETIVRLIYQIDGIEAPLTDKADQRTIKLRREDYITDDLESLFHILRKKRNLSQQSVADYLGISRTAYNNTKAEPFGQHASWNSSQPSLASVPTISWDEARKFRPTLLSILILRSNGGSICCSLIQAGKRSM